MTPKQRRKKLKLETKLLGYMLVVNAIFMVNVIWYKNYIGGNLDACTNITKYVLGAGIILLLGRKAISEIAIKAVEVFAKK